MIISNNRKAKITMKKKVLITVVVVLMGFLMTACADSPSSQQVTIPDVTGMTIEEADLVLEEFGVSVGNVTYDTSNQETGVVLMQNPSPGDSGTKTQVDLIIGDKQ